MGDELVNISVRCCSFVLPTTATATATTATTTTATTTSATIAKTA